MTWKEEIKKNTIEGQPLSEVIHTVEDMLKKAGHDEDYMIEPKDITINSNLLNLILQYLKQK